MTALTPERIAELRALLAKSGYSYDTFHDWRAALLSEATALLDAAEIGLGRTCYDASAERAAKWKACAEELVDVIQHSAECDHRYAMGEAVGHSDNCQKCRGLARFDALAKEDA